MCVFLKNKKNIQKWLYSNLRLSLLQSTEKRKWQASLSPESCGGSLMRPRITQPVLWKDLWHPARTKQNGDYIKKHFPPPPPPKKGLYDFILWYSFLEGKSLDAGGGSLHDVVFYYVIVGNEQCFQLLLHWYQSRFQSVTEQCILTKEKKRLNQVLVEVL